MTETPALEQETPVFTADQQNARDAIAASAEAILGKLRKQLAEKINGHSTGKTGHVGGVLDPVRLESATAINIGFERINDAFWALGEAADNLTRLGHAQTPEAARAAIDASLARIGSRMDENSHVGRLHQASRRLGALHRTNEPQEVKELRETLSEVENIYKQAEVFGIERAKNHAAAVKKATEFSSFGHYF